MYNITTLLVTDLYNRECYTPVHDSTNRTNNHCYCATETITNGNNHPYILYILFERMKLRNCIHHLWIIKLYLKKYIAIFHPKIIYISLSNSDLGMKAVLGIKWRKVIKTEPKSHKNRRVLLDTGNIPKYTNSNLA